MSAVRHPPHPIPRFAAALAHPIRWLVAAVLAHGDRPYVRAHHDADGHTVVEVDLPAEYADGALYRSCRVRVACPADRHAARHGWAPSVVVAPEVAHSARLHVLSRAFMVMSTDCPRDNHDAVIRRAAQRALLRALSTGATCGPASGQDGPPSL